MAIYLQFDKRQLGNSGLIPLKRGDDWLLQGQVVTKFVRQVIPFDLTNCSATAFFEAATGGNVTRSVDLLTPAAGLLEIAVPATGENNTTEVALAENGISCYLTVEHPTLGLLTIDTELPVLEIKDRGYAES